MRYVSVHKRNTTYSVFWGICFWIKALFFKMAICSCKWNTREATGESLKQHCNIHYCCRLVLVQFCEIKCQIIWKFWKKKRKKKELVCLNVSTGDTRTNNAIHTAHSSKSQILLLKKRTYDPKQNYLTLKFNLTLKLALLRAEKCSLWPPKVLSNLKNSVIVWLHFMCTASVN